MQTSGWCGLLATLPVLINGGSLFTYDRFVVIFGGTFAASAQLGQIYDKVNQFWRSFTLPVVCPAGAVPAQMGPNVFVVPCDKNGPVIVFNVTSSAAALLVTTAVANWTHTWNEVAPPFLLWLVGNTRTAWLVPGDLNPQNSPPHSTWWQFDVAGFRAAAPTTSPNFISPFPDAMTFPRRGASWAAVNQTSTPGTGLLISAGGYSGNQGTLAVDLFTGMTCNPAPLYSLCVKFDCAR
jgi:hypothetical protein